MILLAVYFNFLPFGSYIDTTRLSFFTNLVWEYSINRNLLPKLRKKRLRMHNDDI